MLPDTRSYIILSILLLLTVNIVFLDIVFFSPQNEVSHVAAENSVVNNVPVATECSQACKSYINTVAAASIASPSATVTVTSVDVPVSLPKEYYVPLGLGFTRSDEYDDLFGADVFIDTVKYPRIQKVTFEVYLRNPTGNGITYAKLFNVTDKHDVWFSEVSMVGGGSGRREATIQLEPGNKEYRVKLRSSMKYDVYVDNARIKIVTN